MRTIHHLVLFTGIAVFSAFNSEAQQNNRVNNSQKEGKMINAKFQYEKKHVEVNGIQMAYMDAGNGDPIVFLHGNPTSSYIWRNIIPYVQGLGRCIAPDLVGMGDSQKLPDSGPSSYTFAEQRQYLDALLDKLNVHQNIIFVGYDWGAALAFDWSYRHPGAVKGIAYMETIIKSRTWDELPEPARKIFQALRSPTGDQMVLQENSFIEVNLPRTIQRTLSEEEMTEYRRPFLSPGESRRPMLTWARQLPIEGEPADVSEIVKTYGEWLSHSSIPKLFIQGNPGTMSAGEKKFCQSWPAQTEVTVRGLHNLQEDSPDEIGTALSVWLQSLK